MKRWVLYLLAVLITALICASTVFGNDEFKFGSLALGMSRAEAEAGIVGLYETEKELSEGGRLEVKYDGVAMDQPARLVLQFRDDKLYGMTLFLIYESKRDQQLDFPKVIDVFSAWDDNINCVGQVDNSEIGMFTTVFHNGFIDVLFIGEDPNGSGLYIFGFGKYEDRSSWEQKYDPDELPPAKTMRA